MHCSLNDCRYIILTRQCTCVVDPGSTVKAHADLGLPWSQCDEGEFIMNLLIQGGLEKTGTILKSFPFLYYRTEVVKIWHEYNSVYSSFYAIIVVPMS